MSLDLLPRDELLAIFKHLPTMVDLFRCRRVCRRWRYLIESYGFQSVESFTSSSVFPQNWPENRKILMPPQAEAILRKCLKCVVDVQLENISATTSSTPTEAVKTVELGELLDILQLGPNLKHLSVCYRNPEPLMLQSVDRMTSRPLAATTLIRTAFDARAGKSPPPGLTYMVYFDVTVGVVVNTGGPRVLEIRNALADNTHFTHSPIDMSLIWAGQDGMESERVVIVLKRRPPNPPARCYCIANLVFGNVADAEALVALVEMLNE